MNTRMQDINNLKSQSKKYGMYKGPVTTKTSREYFKYTGKELLEYECTFYCNKRVSLTEFESDLYLNGLRNLD